MMAIVGRTIAPTAEHCCHFSILLWTIGVVAFIVAGGCGGNGGGASSSLSINPAAAADKAIELYDKDGSGSLNDQELAASPGFLAARDRYDTDADRQISRDEIQNRLKTVSTGTSLLMVECRVLQGGRPLAGANVRFLPDPALEGALLPASGTTDANGRVNPSVAEDQMPEERRGVPIMQPGVYRVEIEHANVKKPHKPLGCEIDEFARGGTEVTLNL
jgi:hypothetical protein